MSFVEGMGASSFTLSDPTVVLYVCIALIVLCAVLDAPAIASALRVLVRRRRFAKASRVSRAD
jgi:hypothetical protein